MTDQHTPPERICPECGPTWNVGYLRECNVCNSPWVPSPVTATRMRITWHHGDRGYSVSIPNYDGGWVVGAPVADLMLDALRAVVFTYPTFRNVPKEDQDWTSIDDDALALVEAAIAAATLDQ